MLKSIDSGQQDNKDNNNCQWIESIDWDVYERLAAIGYKPKDIAYYFEIPYEEFTKEFLLPDSKLMYHYQHGTLFFRAAEGVTLLGQGITGNDSAQTARLDRLRSKIDWQNSLDDIVYD